MTNNKENIRLLISLGLAMVVIAAILWLLGKVVSSENSKRNIGKNSFQIPSLNSSSDNISLGEEIFVARNSPPEKVAGSKAFAEGNFAAAVREFEISLKTHRNDPEALIYLNNANAELNKGKSEILKAAVILPLSSSVDQAEEILRGVAQAQDEVNHSRAKINGAFLQLQIFKIRDFRDFNAIEQLNLKLIDDPNIVAVVGFSPNVSIYNKRGLVMVSPINPRKQSGRPEYVFYATPSADIFSDKLAEYIVQKASVRNIAVCKDTSFQSGRDKARQDTVSIESIVDSYKQSIGKYGGKITNTNCNFDDSNFQASDILSRAISDGAEGLLLIPSPNKINNPSSGLFKLVQANRGRLPLFGFQTLYIEKTLRYGKENVKGMVLTVPWHRDANPDYPFAQKAADLWGGEVSPRTAVAYDALQTIISGLKQANTREGLQKALSKPNFVAYGAQGKIKFSPQTGVREGGVLLVEIDSCNPSTTKGCTSDSMLQFKLVQEPQNNQSVSPTSPFPNSSISQNKPNPPRMMSSGMSKGSND